MDAGIENLTYDELVERFPDKNRQALEMSFEEAERLCGLGQLDPIINVFFLKKGFWFEYVMGKFPDYFFLFKGPEILPPDYADWRAVYFAVASGKFAQALEDAASSEVVDLAALIYEEKLMQYENYAPIIKQAALEINEGRLTFFNVIYMFSAAIEIDGGRRLILPDELKLSKEKYDLFRKAGSIFSKIARDNKMYLMDEQFGNINISEIIASAKTTDLDTLNFVKNYAIEFAKWISIPENYNSFEYSLVQH